MSTATLERVDIAPEVTTGDDDPEDMWHVWCCTPDRALCGAKIDPEDAISEDDWDFDPDACPMCALMIESPCNKCGGK